MYSLLAVRADKVCQIALLAALAACSAPERTPEKADAPPRAVAATRAVVDERIGALRLRARRADGSAVEVAELVGAWIDIGDGTQWLAPGTWSSAGDTLSADCAGPTDHAVPGLADHAVRILVRHLPDGDFAVSVEDRVGVPVELAGLGVAWRLLAAPPPDEVCVPLLHPEPDGVAGDVAFRAPVGFLRSGQLALAVLPDLDALSASRRLPEALTVDRDAPGGPILLHAAVAQRIEAGPDHARTTHESDRSVRIRDAVVRVGHRLHITGDAAPGRTLAWLIDRIWQDRMTEALTRSAAPFAQESWNSTIADTLDERVARDLRPSRRSSLAVAFLADPDDDDGGWDSARFGARDNCLVDAVALARSSGRLGLPERREIAAQLVRFALLAPRRGGLTPQTYRVRRDDRSEEWSAGDPDGPRPDAFCAADSAATAVLLIELAELLPEFREDVRTRAGSLARFLVGSQRGDGAIPGVFEPRYLRPVALSEDALPGATAGPALFLARFAAWTGDTAARDAARQAIRFIAGRLADTDAPIADPSIAHGLLRDPRSGDTVRDLAPLTAAARAALTLAADEIALTPIADDLLGALAELQQAWTPPWLVGARLRGGFGGSNDDATWNARGQAAAAQAMLDGYDVLGRRRWLERGATGLRAALVEPSPILPVTAHRADRLVRLAAATAVAERCRARFGQALVDVDGGFAVGLDSVWFEDVEFEENRLGFELRTTARIADPIDVRLASRAPLPVGYGFTVEASTRPAPDRLLVQPAREPMLWFRPPPQLDAQLAWKPHARYDGPALAPGTVFVELLQRDQVFATLDLQRPDSGGDILDSGDASFRPTGVPVGERIGARLVHRIGARRVQAPPVGQFEITIGSMSCIDPGDDLETTLLYASPGANVVRFVDGRENARSIARGESFVHALPVPPDAAAVEVRIHAEGRLEVIHAKVRPAADGRLEVIHDDDGPTLHVDPESVAEGDRVVAFRLADPRLWPDGKLRLRFQAASDFAAVARVEFAASGSAARTESVDDVRQLPDPDASIELLIQPVQLGARSAPSEEFLRQALIGDQDYRFTPGPNERATSGSLSTWIARLSGGRSHVVATFQPVVLVGSSVDELRAGAGWEAVLAQLGETDMRSQDRHVDALVLVHAGRPIAPTSGLSIDGVPVVVLSEREPDGSFLSLGRIARELLSRLYRLEDLGRPENGNFGTLGLTSGGDSHEPALPIGVNLIRTGWANLVDLVPDHGSIHLPPLVDGRTMLRVALHQADAASGVLPGSPDILLETRRGSTGGDGAGPAGVLIYRRFRGGQEPIVRLLDGRTVRPRTWRLSPNQSTMHTPFVAGIPGGPHDPYDSGDSGDLFTDTFRLDDRSIPSLSTPRGETPWKIERVDSSDDSTASLRVHWTGIDLITEAQRGWLAGHRTSLGPIVEGRESDEIGSVLCNDETLELRLPPSDGAALHAVLVDPGARGPRRLLGRIGSVEGGRLRIEVLHRGTRLARMDAAAGPVSFAVDLPPAAAGSELVLAFTRQDGAPRARLESLITVPRSANAVAVTLPGRDPRTVRAVDGRHHSVAWTLQLDEHGHGQLRVPILPPSSRGVLRVAATVRHGDSRSVHLRIALRPAGGDAPIEILDDLEFASVEGGLTPVPVALCELPSTGQRGLAFLELDARGEPGAELHLLSLETDRF